jgi:hypothetical protein
MGSESKSPKIFCIILTDNSNNSYLQQNIIYNSWAKKCDNYKFIMTVPTDLNLGSTVNIDDGIEFEYNNLSFIQPPGYVKDNYTTLSEKMFMTFKYLYNHYNDYDWYLKADHDTYIFMDNLRKFISDKNASLPVTYGYDFKVIVPNGYHSGGGGYLLSKFSFGKIGKKVNGNRDWNYRGAEDVDVALVLRNLDVYPEKSLDDEGRERFHPFDINLSFYVKLAFNLIF